MAKHPARYEKAEMRIDWSGQAGDVRVNAGTNRGDNQGKASEKPTQQFA